MRAAVAARATQPSGRYMDGDGYCSIDEPRFKTNDGKQKVENDLRGTATTRAMNRAISGLLGTGEVSAEELSGGDGDGPPHGPEASIELQRTLADWARRQDTIETVKDVKRHAGGYLPEIAARAMVSYAMRIAQAPVEVTSEPAATGELLPHTSPVEVGRAPASPEPALGEGPENEPVEPASVRAPASTSGAPGTSASLPTPDTIEIEWAENLQHCMRMTGAPREAVRPHALYARRRGREGQGRRPGLAGL